SSITDGLVLGLALAFILGAGLPFGAKLFTRDVDVLHLIKIGILMVITTLGDLHGLYPGIILQNKVLRIKDKSTDQVLVIGATNRLDIPALLRKGRFDKIIRVGLPSKDGRFAILKVISSSDNLCIMNLASR
ncbi:hypothetical protein S245_065975, partial [Arachis hypogaea]